MLRQRQLHPSSHRRAHRGPQHGIDVRPPKCARGKSEDEKFLMVLFKRAATDCDEHALYRYLHDRGLELLVTGRKIDKIRLLAKRVEKRTLKVLSQLELEFARKPRRQAAA